MTFDALRVIERKAISNTAAAIMPGERARMALLLGRKCAAVARNATIARAPAPSH